MPLSGYAVDTFISQGLSRLTECRAAPIEPQFPGHDTWLAWFILKSIVAFPRPQDKAALACAVIRRSDAALEAYDEGRNALQKFVSERRDISVYFRALRNFESVVANVYEAAEFLRLGPLGLPGHRPHDGSARQRLNATYNGYRHIMPQNLPPDHLHAVWIENDGLHTLEERKKPAVGFETLVLTFDELRESVCEIAGFAQKIYKANDGDAANPETTEIA